MKKKPRYFLKNLENREFHILHPSNDGHVTDPHADRVSEMVLTVAQKNFDDICYKSCLLLFAL